MRSIIVPLELTVRLWRVGRERQGDSNRILPSLVKELTSVRNQSHQQQIG
jgi:hypothetical protein